MADGTPSTEAYAVFCRFLKTYLTDRDIDATMLFFTDDACGIGTGAQEIAYGRDEIRDLYVREIADLPVSIDFRILRYWESNPAQGVYNCMGLVDTSLPVNDQTAHLSARLTLNLVRKGDGLLISQLHMSVANTEQEEFEAFPVQKALSEELLFNNEVCGVMQYRLFQDGNIMIERLNKEAARLMKIPQKDILCRKLFRLESTVHPDDLSVTEARTALEIGASSEPQEYRSRGMDGSLTWVVGYSSALDRLTDQDGREYTLLQSIFIDIDAKKKSELELQKYLLDQYLDAYRKDIEETLRGLGLGFWSIREDPDKGPMLTQDSAGADAMGVPQDADPAEVYAEIAGRVFPADLEAFGQYLQDIREKGRSECTYRYNHSTRGLRYIRCSGWWDGSQRRGFHMDVTEQVEREHRYQQALEETNSALKDALRSAQQANAAKTRFLSNMSHDIRTPMNAIIGFSTIAARKLEDTERVRDCLTKILSSSEHLLGIINDILDMSRIESGKTTVEYSKTTVSEIIRNVISLVQPQVHSKQLNFHVDTLDIRDEYILADALKVRQILLNILGNAIKFTRPEGAVSMKIAELPAKTPGTGLYRFIISDTGVGISEAFIEHIFEPFEREKSSTISRTTGTGLGMSITKSLVDMMGGSISVKSKLGEGSEFTVDLEFRLQTDVPGSRQVEALKGLRVLIVDDDFQTCESVTKMLDSVGIRSDWTTVAREAVNRVQMACSANDPFYGYIIDWIMPEMNGIELTRRIRKIAGDDTPIIILTAYDWEDIADEARQAGVTGFCTKPLFLSDLTMALLDHSEETPERSSKTPTFLKQRRILLVEDNELNGEIAKELLEEAGLIVDAACDGEQALELLNASDPGYYHLVLMDIQMPVMDGLTAARQLRQSPRPDLREIPIIAMTANAFREDRESAIAAGMNDHLAKPLDLTKVLEVLERYME